MSNTISIREVMTLNLNVQIKVSFRNCSLNSKFNLTTRFNCCGIFEIDILTICGSTHLFILVSVFAVDF